MYSLPCTKSHSSHHQFAALVDLIVSCGEYLKQFTEKSARNATYTSTDFYFQFSGGIGIVDRRVSTITSSRGSFL